MSAADRCPVCDRAECARPTVGRGVYHTEDDEEACPACAVVAECDRHPPVDWRARALAAERNRDAARETNRALNRRNQEQESLLADFTWALDNYGLRKGQPGYRGEGMDGIAAAKSIRQDVDDARAALTKEQDYHGKTVRAIGAALGIDHTLPPVDFLATCVVIAARAAQMEGRE